MSSNFRTHRTFQSTGHFVSQLVVGVIALCVTVSGNPLLAQPGPGGPSQEEIEMMQMEMEMQGRGGPGYGPPGRGGPSSSVLNTYLGNLKPLTMGFKLTSLLEPNTETVVDGGPVLSKEAEQVFAAGDQGLATSLMYGHMATEYEEAVVAIRSAKYSAILRQPVWNIRFGVSMVVRGEDLALDAEPIREGKTSIGRGAPGRGVPGGGFDDGEDFDAMDEMEEMESQMQASGPSFGRSGPGSRRPKPSSQPKKEMLSKEASEKLDKTVGLVAEVLAAEFNERFRRGDFGSILTTVAAPVELDETIQGSGLSAPIAPSMSEGLLDAMGETAMPLPLWQPGIAFLGEEAWQDLLPLAKAKHIDMILHLDVVLKRGGRDDRMQNISRCRLVNVATGKSIGVSKAMDNWEAAQLASSGRSGERDYVEDQLGYLFSIVDREIKVADMPAVSQSVARRRIAALIADASGRKLRSLAEIRYYQAQDLVTEQEVETAFDIIGGVDALMLLHGPRGERLSTVRKMAVKAQGTDSDS